MPEVGPGHEPPAQTAEQTDVSAPGGDSFDTGTGLANPANRILSPYPEAALKQERRVRRVLRRAAGEQRVPRRRHRERARRRQQVQAQALTLRTRGLAATVSGEPLILAAVRPT